MDWAAQRLTPGQTKTRSSGPPFSIMKSGSRTFGYRHLDMTRIGRMFWLPRMPWELRILLSNFLQRFTCTTGSMVMLALFWASLICSHRPFSWHTVWVGWLLKRYIPSFQSYIEGYHKCMQWRFVQQSGSNAKGILFLGTPHRGADLAGLLNSILKVTLSQKTFVKQIESNSDSIQDINNLFRKPSKSLRLISYYESKGIPGLGVHPRPVELTW